MTLKIEAGKFYRTRDGRKVGPMRLGRDANSTSFKWAESHDDEGAWDDEGDYGLTHLCGNYSRDLIAEWTDEPAATPEVGTLRELNVQPGDVVECVSVPGAWAEWTVGKQYTATSDGLPGDKSGPQKSSVSTFRIISRATPAMPFGHARLPSGAVVDLTAITTPFGLLDEVYGPGAQEALRAHGGPWEGWCEGAKWEKIHDPYWSVTSTYRVKPQPPAPVVKTVTLLTGAVYNWVAEPENECGDRNTHRITFDLIDGKPDCASIRMVAL